MSYGSKTVYDCRLSQWDRREQWLSVTEHTVLVYYKNHGSTEKCYMCTFFCVSEDNKQARVPFCLIIASYWANVPLEHKISQLGVGMCLPGWAPGVSAAQGVVVLVKTSHRGFCAIET